MLGPLRTKVDRVERGARALKDQEFVELIIVLPVLALAAAFGVALDNYRIRRQSSN